MKYRDLGLISPVIKDDFVYLAIPKNGHTTYKLFFEKNGWLHDPNVNLTRLSRINKNYKFFAHIQDPHTRHTKGIVEMLERHISPDKEGIDSVLAVNDFLSKDETFARLLTLTVLDEHTFPIVDMFPPTLDPYTVHWIPLDHSKYSSEYLTNKFLSANKIKLTNYIKDRIHVSSPEKVQLQRRIEKLKKGFRLYHKFFTNSVLLRDLQLYKHALDNIE